MSDGPPAVLVMAPSGETADGQLAAALRSEAERWAGEVAPGRVHFADGPVAEATERVFAERPGPVLAIWPVLARFRPEHAVGALGDLEAGAGLVIGPVIDGGGLYLLGLSRPLGELVSVPDETWSGEGAMSAALQAAAEAGLEVGILRAERALRSPDDVRAALADPLTPDQIGRILVGLKQD
ncbi:MAG TPA: hypothetical protein VGH24_00495 [Solirubrobacteraceae bacterium]|jgi:hypothetical protein